MPRYLFGPVSPHFSSQKLAAPRASGECLTFDLDGNADVRMGLNDSWADVESRLPPDWVPDLIALWPAYGMLPRAAWEANVPVVLLAADWTLHWHHYRILAPHVEAILTDARGVEAFTAAGLSALPMLLYGCGLDDLEQPGEDRRDIDVLFVGRFNPAVQAERMPWLGRLARLAGRHNVVIRTEVFGAEYRALLRRSRIAFNHGGRGECNQRVFEAAAARALLFQEAGNREVPAVFADRRECVYYRDDDFESLLDYYLAREPERRRIAEAARAKLSCYRFDRLWPEIVDRLDASGLRDRLARRPEPPGNLVRGCELLNLLPQNWSNPDILTPLKQGEPSALSSYLLGLASEPAEAVGCFAASQSIDSKWAPARLARAEALAAAGRTEEATHEAKNALGLLAVESDLPLSGPAASYPPRFDDFRVSWERAAWIHAGDPSAEVADKRALLQWRLHQRLASWTGSDEHLAAAVAILPNQPATRAALGKACLQKDRADEAVSHLRLASTADPFNSQLASSLAKALEESGDLQGAARARRDFACVVRAAGGRDPQRVPPSKHPGRVHRLLWDGGVNSLHSYARVNREICAQLIARGHELSIAARDQPNSRSDLPMRVAGRVGAVLSGSPEVWVRHCWPPDFSPPPEGRFVLIQPWEYGSLPKTWAEGARQAAEVWAYSQAVRNCYLEAGLAPERVAVVPLGIDPRVFHPGAPPLPLPTVRRFRFLFVGGTIHRKGFDLLLDAYARAFTAADDVALVVKDVGARSFYRGQTSEGRINELRSRPRAPEVVYLQDAIPSAQLPGLYTACDCLALPFRGEGFGLSAAEAMACGRPAVVTAASPATDYCTPDTAYLVPAKRFSRGIRVNGLETVSRPWQHEPDPDGLALALRAAFDDPAGARARGLAASAAIRSSWTWTHTVQKIEERLARLIG